MQVGCYVHIRLKSAWWESPLKVALNGNTPTSTPYLH